MEERRSLFCCLFSAQLILLSLFFCRLSTAADRPNVLMIIVDDMNDWVGCLGGHPDVKTPNIDRLAKRGLLFTNAHVAAPVCNPSRVATLTGLRPSTTGIYGNETKWMEALPNVATIPQHFKANGYYVTGGGKVNHHMPGFNRRSDWHDYFDQVFDSHYQDQLARGLNVKRFDWPVGFPLNGLEAVKTFSKPPQNANEFDWGALDRSDAEMGDGKMVEWAVQFLKQPPPKIPFFLAAGIYRPHLPFYAPKQYFDMYPLDQITPPIRTNGIMSLPSPSPTPSNPNLQNSCRRPMRGLLVPRRNESKLQYFSMARRKLDIVHITVHIYFCDLPEVFHAVSLSWQEVCLLLRRLFFKLITIHAKLTPQKENQIDGRKNCAKTRCIDRISKVSALVPLGVSPGSVDNRG